MVVIEPIIQNILSNMENEEHAKMITDYIEDLLEENITLEEIRDENEQEINHLENDLKGRPSARFLELVREVVEEQWKYLVPTYKTKEEILDRLEFLIRYEA